MNLPIEEQNLTGVNYFDERWISSTPLTLSNVMVYFSNSPFYNRSCKNSYVSMQRTQFEFDSPGLEYIIEYANEEEGIFVILAQYRESSHVVIPKAMYYITNGSIYQSPDLYSIIEAHTNNALFEFENTLDKIKDKWNESTQS